jgi:prepilin-type N-terminal cleavage/methylation domain-containing protein
MTPPSWKKSFSMAVNPRSRQGGFTLIEILIALALATALTLVMFSAVTPWLNLKHKLDTDHRLAELQDAVGTAYQAWAMQVDSSQPSGSAVLAIGQDPTNPIPSSTVAVTATSASGQTVTTCAANAQANALLAPYLAHISVNGILDGYSQPICIFISQSLSQTVEGVTLYYRVIALVSAGQDGRLDSAAPFDSVHGTLTLTGDDVGIIVSGFPIQYRLYKETKERLDRTAEMYSSFFTARFQGNVGRDYSLDYFTTCVNPSLATCTATGYDYDGTTTLPAPTGGSPSGWLTVAAALAPALGLGPEEEKSAWESASDFEVANQMFANSGDEVFNVQVQEPASKNVNLPPYTALLRAAIPTPADLGASYALKVISGSY